ncbi:MAG TPA: hypothetical protein VGF55_29550 [Gemmataceae bacterium]|jgi:hypothetical protein
MIDETFPRLSEIAEYHTGRIELLRQSVVTCILGGSLIFFGVLGFHDPLAAVLFGGVGLVFVVTGWLSYRHVIPGLLLAEALLLGLIGAAFVGAAVLFWAAFRVERGWMVEFFVVGGVMVGWAAFGLARARRAVALLAARPDAAESAWLEAIVDEVWAGDPSEGADAVAFTTHEFGNNVYVWQGRFFGDTAVFVKRPGDGLLVARRLDVHVSDRGRLWLGREHRARLRIGRRQLNATIVPESLTNLWAWREAAS